MTDNFPLEDRLESAPVPIETDYTSAAEQRVGSGLRNYLVDCSATSLFYTPTMAVTELVSGMESEEIVKSRLMGAVAHFSIGRPYGIFRQWWADRWQVGPESPKWKKLAVDTSAMVIMQTPIYSSMLYLAGASKEEILVALPLGLAWGASTGRPFGWVLDKWRKVFGTKPTLEE